MLDKILPQNLAKLMTVFETKYRLRDQYREMAAIKCIVDFRIAFYTLTQ